MPIRFADNRQRIHLSFKIMNRKPGYRILPILLITLLSNFHGVYGQQQNLVPPIKNVVLVHGAFLDGAGWEGVYKILTEQGFKVSVTQHTLRDFDDDVAMVERTLGQQEGPLWPMHRFQLRIKCFRL